MCVRVLEKQRAIARECVSVKFFCAKKKQGDRRRERERERAEKAVKLRKEKEGSNEFENEVA